MNYQVIDHKYHVFLKEMKTFFEKNTNEILFQKRNTLKIVSFEESKYVVKSFKVPHLLNRIIYRFFRDSKAKRSYVNSLRLLDLGMNTPKPIGYIEYTSLYFLNESFYVSEFFDYDFEIRAVLKDKVFPDRETIFREFIKFTYDLHEKGVYHIDYSPGNILVKKEGDRYIFSIIDVNRMKFLSLDMPLRMQSLSKLTNDEEDNSLMVSYYAKEASQEKIFLQNLFQKALKKQQRYLLQKKKWKALKNQKSFSLKGKK
jgi:serine/threonine protein kinase